jgi:hypothetical protein
VRLESVQSAMHALGWPQDIAASVVAEARASRYFTSREHHMREVTLMVSLAPHGARGWACELTVLTAPHACDVREGC